MNDDHASPFCTIDDSIEEGMTPAERLRLARERAGFETATDAASALGVSKHTYIHHESGVRGYPAKKAALYGRRFAVSPEWLLFGRKPNEATPVLVKINREVPVLGSVQAGLFAPIPDEPEVEAMIPLVLPGYESASLFALKVVGESMNLHYPDGTIIVVAPAAEVGVRDGDHVIVRHHRNGMAETTVKEIKQDKDGVLLIPRSTNPTFLPVRLVRQRDADEGHEIIGVVVSAYSIRPVQRKPMIQI